MMDCKETDFQDNGTVVVSEGIYPSYIKRVLDIILSGFALVCLSPLLIVICILEIVFHGKPVIYKTKRPGKDGKIFEIYKFRSMTNERGTDGLLLPEEDRLTKFGHFIRKTSIDELPELINIFRGDMSIIGPRPLLIEYLPLYTPRHMMRHAVRPGLACVRIMPSTSKSWTWREQFENDIYYVENISFITDVRMIFAVIRETLRGADYRANDTRVPFTGDNLDEIKSKQEANIHIRFDSIQE